MMEERSGHRSLLHFLCAAAFPPLAIAMSCLFVVHRKLLSSATGKRVKRPVGAHPPPHRPPARCAAGASVKTASCALRPRYGKAPMRLGELLLCVPLARGGRRASPCGSVKREN